MNSICLNYSSADQSIGKLMQNILAKWGPITETFSVLVVAVLILGICILMMAQASYSKSIIFIFNGVFYDTEKNHNGYGYIRIVHNHVFG